METVFFEHLDFKMEPSAAIKNSMSIKELKLPAFFFFFPPAKVKILLLK